MKKVYLGSLFQGVSIFSGGEDIEGFMVTVCVAADKK